MNKPFRIVVKFIVMSIAGHLPLAAQQSDVGDGNFGLEVTVIDGEIRFEFFDVPPIVVGPPDGLPPFDPLDPVLFPMENWREEEPWTNWLDVEPLPAPRTESPKNEPHPASATDPSTSTSATSGEIVPEDFRADRQISNLIWSIENLVRSSVPQFLWDGSVLSEIHHRRAYIERAADLHGVPAISIAAILYQENLHLYSSKAKNVIRFAGDLLTQEWTGSYGLAEVQTKTAAEVLGWNPESVEHRLLLALVSLSDQASIQIAAANLHRNQELLMMTLNPVEAAKAHNFGPVRYRDYISGDRSMNLRIASRVDAEALTRIKRLFPSR